MSRKKFKAYEYLEYNCFLDKEQQYQFEYNDLIVHRQRSIQSKKNMLL